MCLTSFQFVLIPCFCVCVQALDDGIFVFFAGEMVVKMVALGVIGQKGYLGDTWNRLDFFIVIVGWVLCRHTPTCTHGHTHLTLNMSQKCACVTFVESLDTCLMPVKCQACVWACGCTRRRCVRVWMLHWMTIASVGPERRGPQRLVVKRLCIPENTFPADTQGLPRSAWSGCRKQAGGFPLLQHAGVLPGWTQRQPISHPDRSGSPPTESHQQSSQ